MERSYVIALDTHCTFTEIGVLTPGGRLTHRGRCPTAIPDLAKRIADVSRPRHLVLEEGPLADWLMRHLRPHVDEVLICDPRRNHLIAKDSDKDDPIDVEKLARLYRGGYVKAVHHPESLARMVFKRHVGLYHDSVRARVRLANRVMAEARLYGVFVSEAKFSEPKERRGFEEQLPASPMVRSDVRWLLHAYDAAAERAAGMRESLIRHAKKESMIVRFHALPGVKWIRASTFFVYVDTPRRFPSKQALWKYLGIGLERRHSGAGPERVQVPRRVHRVLKSTILGAAKSAIRSRENPFAEQHERWIDGGMTPRNARRNVA